MVLGSKMAKIDPFVAFRAMQNLKILFWSLKTLLISPSQLYFEARPIKDPQNVLNTCQGVKILV